MRLLAGALALTLSSQSAMAQTSYDGCIAEAQRAPSAGLRMAEQWRNAGGGLAARHCRALALAALGLFAEAALEAETLAAEAPDSALRADLLTQAGEFRMAAADAVSARTLFDRALAAEPGAIEALEGRARAAAAQRDFASAIADLNRLLWASPNDAEALALRAAARRQSGDLQGALSDAGAAVSADPLSAVAYFERGAARAVTGNREDARADWREAERLDPGGEIARLAADNLARLP